MTFGHAVRLVIDAVGFVVVIAVIAVLLQIALWRLAEHLDKGRIERLNGGRK